MIHKAKRQTYAGQGFTLVELMLAMAFISVMLIAIALCTIQVINIYNRGMTLRQVNLAGRELSSSLARSFAESTAFDIEHSGPSTVPGEVQAHSLQTKVDGADQLSGRLCTGRYSYIWNTGKAITTIDVSSSDSRLNRFRLEGGSPTTPDGDREIRLVRVPDDGGSYCLDPDRLIDPTGAQELLDSGDRPLAIHYLMPTTSSVLRSTTTQQQLYTIKFVLGTDEVGTLDFSPTGDDATCKPPSDLEADQDYCAVNVFSVTVRAGL